MTEHLKCMKLIHDITLHLYNAATVADAALTGITEGHPTGNVISNIQGLINEIAKLAQTPAQFQNFAFLTGKPVDAAPAEEVPAPVDAPAAEVPAECTESGCSI